MGEVLKPFGRYLLLDLLTQGGMAEIYRAEKLTPQGASRLLILKRIQATHFDREEFHRMFWSEISLMMRFRHPNIVQLYDFGEEKGQPYLTMEYIQGLSLRALLAKFRQREQRIPFEVALWIGIQAAAGLDYAHGFKDPFSGKPLKVVHRDVSPHNILISYEGEVKLIDFGISKADVLGEITRSGLLKGKPSYMAPEYITRREIDARFDVFSLGVILWEMLTGKRLFNATTDRGVLKQVQACDEIVVPPSQVSPLCPEELDQVILKALARDPEKRYQSAAELRRDLRKFLILLAPNFDGSDFAKVIQELLAAEITSERESLKALLGKSELMRIDEKEKEQAQNSVSLSLDQEPASPMPARATRLVRSKREDPRPIALQPPPLPAFLLAQQGSTPLPPEARIRVTSIANSTSASAPHYRGQEASYRTRALTQYSSSVGDSSNDRRAAVSDARHRKNRRSGGASWILVSMLLGTVMLHQSWRTSIERGRGVQSGSIQALTAPPTKDSLARRQAGSSRAAAARENSPSRQLASLRPNSAGAALTKAPRDLLGSSRLSSIAQAVVSASESMMGESAPPVLTGSPAGGSKEADSKLVPIEYFKE